MKKTTALYGVVIAFIAIVAMYLTDTIPSQAVAGGMFLLPVFGLAALTKDRDTVSRDGEILYMGVAGTKKIFAGSLVARDANGYATPGATATTLLGAGRAEEYVDNSAGANGDVNISVRKGIFRFDNSTAGDQITIANIGNDCYIVDDQTVAKTNGTGTRSVAGKVFDVDSNGVWVTFA